MSKNKKIIDSIIYMKKIKIAKHRELQYIEKRVKWKIARLIKII